MSLKVNQDDFTGYPTTTQDDLAVSPMKSRRRSNLASQESLSKQAHCFFCEKPDIMSNLHATSTLEVDKKVRSCAVLLNDNKLTAKLSTGDMIATEAKYHGKCLAGLYNKVRKVKSSVIAKENSDNSVTDLDLEELAFAKLIAYIDEFMDIEEMAVLRLADLANIYCLKQEELGIEQPTVNKTRLKDRILEVFPDLSAYTEGREVLFAFEHEIAGALREAKRKNSDAWHLAKAANIVRKDMLKVKNSFNGTFNDDSQRNSVPESLKTLVGLLLKGPTAEIDTKNNQACLTVSQLILFNCVTKYRVKPESKGSTHHVKYRECPVPLYTALKIHGSTRDKSLIEAFYKLGLSISYDRLLSITTDTANSVIKRYEAENTVCPAKLKDELFTTAQVDNIDHNTSSTTANNSFHGTAISLVQHPTNQNTGQERAVDTFDDSSHNSSNKLHQLPPFYSQVHPVAEPPKDFFSVPGSVTTETFDQSINKQETEIDWLECIRQHSSKKDLAEDECVSWAAYRASHSMPSCYQPAIITLLPLFTENAHSVAMIQHSMKVIQSAVKLVNPSQVPVITYDQPLFAIAKQLQWTKCDEFGEDRFVFMLGGLHIEMSFLNVLGKWLTGSGWAEMITNAEVATPGVADSFLKGKHVTRTRRAHQVTAACLHTLMTNAYKADTEDATRADIECQSFKEWKEKQKSTSPQFLYWSRVLDLQLCLLRLVRSFREGNFKLYIETIKEMLPWVFALDHQNYARWLSIHLRDMLELPKKHPKIHQEFARGSFVVHKTQKPFSCIALDHAHEQVNAVVKGEGGAVGLTESPGALLRWMVSGPELSRMVEEFESSLKTTKNDKKHHEQTPAAQSKFLKDVQNLISAFEESGNPFLDKSNELTALHTKDVMDDAVVKSVKNVKDVGEKQFKSFVNERLVERKLAISEPLKKNNLHILSTQSKKVVSKDKVKVKELKEDCELFSRLFIACQNRDGNLDEFFAFENQPWPPSLAQSGNLRSGQKAGLIKCILNQAADPPSNFQADAVILDGAVIVQMLPVKTARTFEEYFNTIFAPYVLHQLETANRVDLVFDDYRKDSLKTSTREKRGSGQRRKVLPNALIPCDWKGFLRVDENKTELFRYLSEKVRDFLQNKSAWHSEC